MATCLNCGSQHARVKDSRVIPADERLAGFRVVICPVCGPRAQEIRDAGPCVKLRLPWNHNRVLRVATGSDGSHEDVAE